MGTVWQALSSYVVIETGWGTKYAWAMVDRLGLRLVVAAVD